MQEKVTISPCYFYPVLDAKYNHNKINAFSHSEHFIGKIVSVKCFKSASLHIDQSYCWQLGH